MAGSALVRFFKELKRRKVIRAAIVYLVVAWLLVEVASVVFPQLLLPEWTVRLVVALAILGFPVALVLAWAVELSPDGLRADTGGQVTGDPETLPVQDHETDADGYRSIAVLPFLNLSNDPENEYFSDGMAEEVLNLLCKLPQLTIASRTSSFSFRGKEMELSAVARKLGVHAILEGSVRRSGERVRITAQLIDGRSDRHLWSEVYDRELKDVFAVQDEIAGNIVKALELALTPVQQQSIERKAATGDMQAYDLYLKGRYFMERGDAALASQMFESAIELDPEFALAWAGAADSRSWMCMWMEQTPEHLQAADEYSLKALQLAPDSAEAHASRGLALSMNGRNVAADEEFQAALEIDPQLFEACYYAARNSFQQSRFREAAERFERANSIRPDDHVSVALRSTAMRSFGSEAETREAARRSVEVTERHLALNPDDALALSRGANDLVHLGEVERGLEWANRAYAINSAVCGYNVACVHALAGETDRAFDLLEEHAAQRRVHASWIVHDSDWDRLRDHPRYKEVLARLV